MNQQEFYSADYFTARDQFVAASSARGFRHLALPIDAPSPTGDLLTIDVAVAGADAATSAMVLSSGVHGVEAPFGSAVQLAFLESLAPDWQPPQGSAIVLLHALNPFGFAWRRRFNENNVDLNRNFLLAEQQYSGAPALSGRFRSMMVPSGFHRRFGFWTARMALLAMRHGIGSFWRTLPVGQYDYPDWLFFGGHAPTQTAEQIDRLLPMLLDAAKEVVHLDFHTGLGRWSECELLLSAQQDPGNLDWWRAHFHETKVKETVLAAASYAIRGGFGEWLQARFPDCYYRYAVAEFGTYSPRRVIQALAQELYWHGRAATQSSDHWSRRRLADMFVPRDPRWRARTLDTALALIRRAGEVLWPKPV